MPSMPPEVNHLNPQMMTSGGAGPISIEDPALRLSGDKRSEDSALRLSSDKRSEESALRLSGDKHPQVRELTRQNEVLKDLVERLHLELEEAVKREQRYRNKAAKLQAEAEEPSVDGAQSAEGPPSLHSSKLAAPPPCDPRMHPHPSTFPSTFHPLRREPSIEHDSSGGGGPLNQGGLLSLSSISVQPSGHCTESLEASRGLGATLDAKTDTARSLDSVHLPQRPTHSHCVKPSFVPGLDLSVLAQYMDENGEESDKDDASEGAFDEEEIEGEEDSGDLEFCEGGFDTLKMNGEALEFLDSASEPGSDQGMHDEEEQE